MAEDTPLRLTCHEVTPRYRLRRFSPFIAMMQSSDSWQRDNTCLAGGLALDGAMARCVFGVRAVAPVSIVVDHVIAEQTAEMPFAEHNNVIQELPPATVDPALGNPVLPRTAV